MLFRRLIIMSLIALIALVPPIQLTATDTSPPGKVLTAKLSGKEIDKQDIHNTEDTDINERWITVIATAYTASKDECGNNKGITASGARVSRGQTIAAPPEFDFGTKLYIKELDHTYTIEDRGNKNYIKRIDGNTIRIDVYMQTKAEAKNFGVKIYHAKILN